MLALARVLTTEQPLLRTTRYALTAIEALMLSCPAAACEALLGWWHPTSGEAQAGSGGHQAQGYYPDGDPDMADAEAEYFQVGKPEHLLTRAVSTSCPLHCRSFAPPIAPGSTLCSFDAQLAATHHVPASFACQDLEIWRCAVPKRSANRVTSSKAMGTWKATETAKATAGIKATATAVSPASRSMVTLPVMKTMKDGRTNGVSSLSDPSFYCRSCKE